MITIPLVTFGRQHFFQMSLDPVSSNFINLPGIGPVSNKIWSHLPLGWVHYNSSLLSSSSHKLSCFRTWAMFAVTHRWNYFHSNILNLLLIWTKLITSWIPQSIEKTLSRRLSDIPPCEVFILNLIWDNTKNLQNSSSALHFEGAAHMPNRVGEFERLFSAHCAWAHNVVCVI